MNNIVWMKTGNIFRQVEDNSSLMPTLPLGIYGIRVQQNGDLALEYMSEKFTFDFKVYNIENDFIDYVMKTFDSSEKNLGILLSGIKGTSKTVTAKILANRMKLPVILVNGAHAGLGDFLAKMNHPVILFFDEFEKTF